MTELQQVILGDHLVSKVINYLIVTNGHDYAPSSWRNTRFALHYLHGNRTNMVQASVITNHRPAWLNGNATSYSLAAG